jgi:hypothetical protein
MRIRTCTLALVALSYLNANLANAQSLSVPDDSKFVVNVDLQALQATQVGGKLMNFVRENIAEEFHKSGQKANKSHNGKDDREPTGQVAFDKVREALGMNPLEEVRGLVISAADFEHPEKSMLVQLMLGKNKGNIEGLLVSLPGYESEEVGDLTIHSAKPDDSTRVYGCLVKGADGNHACYIASKREQILELGLRNRSTSNMKSIDIQQDRKTFLTLQVTQMPTVEFGEGPQTNIAKLISGLVVTLSEDSDNLELRSTLEAGSKKKAEQLKQALQGFIAVAELFAGFDEEEEDLQKIVSGLKQIRVAQEEQKIRVRWSIPTAQVIAMMEEELKDKF